MCDTDVHRKTVRRKLVRKVRIKRRVHGGKIGRVGGNNTKKEKRSRGPRFLSLLRTREHAEPVWQAEKKEWERHVGTDEGRNLRTNHVVSGF